MDFRATAFFLKNEVGRENERHAKHMDFRETTAMSPQRILLLEENPHDRELVAASLRRDGLGFEIFYAQTKEEFQSAMERTKFDLIISGFNLPSYDGMAALAAAKERQSEVPFIFVAGKIGEERAVESLKSGATNFVLKDRLERLAPAVQTALRESQERAEHNQIEQQLRQAQKMDAIGQLVGGVAHDFSNLLLIIRGNAELALMDADLLDEQTRVCINEITAASERAANLIRQLLAFGRKQTMEFRTVNLNELVGNLVRMLSRIIGENINLQCTYAPRLPVFQADTGMIEQVLVNLVLNARDAMPHGGQVIIKTEPANFDESYTRLHPEAQVGEFICLSVSDSGTGIAPEHLARIFEPMFTTKAPGKGTGLGLATVYGIIKQHHGWLEVLSPPGAGATFKIFLPATPPPCPIAAPPEAEADLKGGHERILLVEDDPGVLITTRRVLETFGYPVWVAATGLEALEIWRTRATEIDLLLTDVVLPDHATGRELAEQLWAQRPALKVIFMSGYSSEVAGKNTEFLRQTKSYFLQKPCPSSTLINTVRRCLDGE